MAVDPTEIATAAAAKLKITDVATVQPATDAAIEYVRNYTNLTELPAADPLLDTGLVLLAMRIFQDGPNPGGISSFDGFDSGTFTPRVLSSHLSEYWMHLGSAGSFA